MADPNLIVSVRRATPDDAVRLTELFLAFKQETAAVSPIHDALDADAAVTIAAKVVDFLKSGADWVLVAEQDAKKKLIGFVVCHVWRNLPIYAIAEMGYVSELYVKKSVRGLGVGRALVAEAEQTFRERGLDYARIETIRHYTRNQGYYESLGYEPFLIELRKRL